MLGFYVLLEDPDANVIIALALLQLGFLQVMTYAILLISPGRWLQAKTQQPIGVVSLVIIHVNACCRPADQQHLMMRYSITKYAVVMMVMNIVIVIRVKTVVYLQLITAK